MRIYHIILLFTLLSSCTDSTNGETQSSNFNDKYIQEKIDQTKDSSFQVESNIDSITTKVEQINVTDSNGLKQGKWESYLNGKLWKIDYYKDDKLNGNCIKYQVNGDVQSTEYKMGIRDGYFLQYSPDSIAAQFVTFWEQNEKKWSAFPWELCHLMRPLKGFITEQDTSYIKVPYNSGTLLYEGLIVRNNKEILPTGIHKVYYKAGGIKATIDYQSKNIKVFNENGSLEFSGSLDDWGLKYKK